jgi:hypothetical protein
MIAAAMVGWKALGWGMRLITIFGPILLLGTIYGVWHHKVYQSGYKRAISDIAAQDERAITQAEAKRSVFKQCRAAGRRWDQVEGRCI